MTVAAENQHDLAAHPIHLALPGDARPLHGRTLPLPSHLLAIRAGCDRQIRPRQGRLARAKAHRALPARRTQWLRPRLRDGAGSRIVPRRMNVAVPDRPKPDAAAKREPRGPMPPPTDRMPTPTPLVDSGACPSPGPSGQSPASANGHARTNLSEPDSRRDSCRVLSLQFSHRARMPYAYAYERDIPLTYRCSCRFFTTPAKQSQNHNARCPSCHKGIIAARSAHTIVDNNLAPALNAGQKVKDCSFL